MSDATRVLFTANTGLWVGLLKSRPSVDQFAVRLGQSTVACRRLQLSMLCAKFITSVPKHTGNIE